MSDFLNGVRVNQETLAGLSERLRENIEILNIILLSETNHKESLVRSKLYEIATIGEGVVGVAHAGAKLIIDHSNRRPRAA